MLHPKIEQVSLSLKSCLQNANKIVNCGPTVGYDFVNYTTWRIFVFFQCMVEFYFTEKKTSNAVYSRENTIFGVHE